MANYVVDKDTFAFIENPNSALVTESYTLAASNWDSNIQTVSVNHFSPFHQNMINIPPAEMSLWAQYGIYPIEENARTDVIRFGCETVPAEDLTFTVTQTKLESCNGFVGTDSTITEFIGENVNVTIPDGVITIANAAFEGSSIETLAMPFGIRIIEERAFAECENLTSITSWWQGADGVNFQHIGAEAFAGCTSLESIIFRYGDLESFTIADNAFKDCTGLTSITFRRSASIPASAFSGCTNVNTITIANYWNASADFSFTNNLTATCLSDMIDALADRSETTGKTLTIGATNKARISSSKLSEAEAKNWTIN